jgi:excisionase family DNA binding protein
MTGEPAAVAATDARCREAVVAPEAAPSAQPMRLLPLCTPAEAARLLAVPESWLRRQVTARLVPHTRLGKHLRFSHADLVLIAAAAARPAAAAVPARRPLRGRRPRTSTGGW